MTPFNPDDPSTFRFSLQRGNSARPPPSASRDSQSSASGLSKFGEWALARALRPLTRFCIHCSLLSRPDWCAGGLRASMSIRASIMGGGGGGGGGASTSGGAGGEKAGGGSGFRLFGGGK
jgi:hypothetical protein